MLSNSGMSGPFQSTGYRRWSGEHRPGQGHRVGLLLPSWPAPLSWEAGDRPGAALTPCPRPTRELVAGTQWAGGGGPSSLHGLAALPHPAGLWREEGVGEPGSGGARSLLRASGLGWAPSRKGLPPGAPPAQPRWDGGRLVRLVAWSVTQPERRASEWRNVACQIKLGASKLKIHIYFNRSGCSERDEREGR